MDRADLMRLLNLRPAAPAPAAADPCAARPGGAAVAEGGPEEAGPPSDTALRLDAYDRAQGSRLRGTPDARPLDLPAEAWADFRGLAYLPEPTTVPGCVDRRRLEYVKTLLGSADAQALRAATVLSGPAADLAAKEFAAGFTKLREEDRKREEAGGGRGNPAAENRLAKSALLRAAGRALAAAEEAVEEYGEVSAALGCGPGQGHDGTLDAGRVAAAFAKVKDSATLRRIFDAAGAYRRLAQGKQRLKTVHGYGDMVGVCLDDAVDRLLDEELCQLLDPDLEPDALRRLSERETLAHDHRGQEPAGKGPVIVCVDESGSMTGPPVEQAKALALSLCWLAKHQNRWIALIGFSGGTEGTRLLISPDRPGDTQSLLSWLEHFYGGGTSCDVPCHQLPNVYWPEFMRAGMKQGKTDLIVITDGVVQVPAETIKQFNAWKSANRCRAIGLMLGCGCGNLQVVLDELHYLSRLDVTADSIDRVLSI